MCQGPTYLTCVIAATYTVVHTYIHTSAYLAMILDTLAPRRPSPRVSRRWTLLRSRFRVTYTGGKRRESRGRRWGQSFWKLDKVVFPGTAEVPRVGQLFLHPMPCGSECEDSEQAGTVAPAGPGAHEARLGTDAWLGDKTVQKANQSPYILYLPNATLDLLQPPPRAIR